MQELEVYRGFTLDIGHSGNVTMPWAAWARHDDGHVMKALGQWEEEAIENVKRQVDDYWDAR